MFRIVSLSGLFYTEITSLAGSVSTSVLQSAIARTLFCFHKSTRAMLSPMGNFKRRLSQALPLRRDQRRQSKTLTSLSQPTTPTAEDYRGQADQVLGFRRHVSQDRASSTIRYCDPQNPDPKDFVDPRSPNSQPCLCGPLGYETPGNIDSSSVLSVYSREWDHSTLPASRPGSIRIFQSQSDRGRAGTKDETLRPEKLVLAVDEDESQGPRRNGGDSYSTNDASPKPQNQPRTYPLPKRIMSTDVSSKAQVSTYSLPLRAPMSIPYYMWTVPSNLAQEHQGSEVEELGVRNGSAGEEEEPNSERIPVEVIQSKPPSACDTPSPFAPNKPLWMRDDDGMKVERNFTMKSVLAEYKGDADDNRAVANRGHPSRPSNNHCPQHDISSDRCWLMGIVLVLVLLVLFSLACQGGAMELSLIHVNVIVSIETL
ncbi:hypothetical protein F5Y18DRAFT_320006 [Xylariaceae sp. FL1019]|nr:hypothetical protein F5Y18DRAFT_320006 [Xylariaceae sp. FL1019]